MKLKKSNLLAKTASKLIAVAMLTAMIGCSSNIEPENPDTPAPTSEASANTDESKSATDTKATDDSTKSKVEVKIEDVVYSLEDASFSATAYPAVNLLTWSRVAGATGYRLYRDGVLVYEGSTNYYPDEFSADNILVNGQTYTYTLDAISSSDRTHASRAIYVNNSTVSTTVVANVPAAGSDILKFAYANNEENVSEGAGVEVEDSDTVRVYFNALPYLNYTVKLYKVTVTLEENSEPSFTVATDASATATVSGNYLKPLYKAYVAFDLPASELYKVNVSMTSKVNNYYRSGEEVHITSILDRGVAAESLAIDVVNNGNAADPRTQTVLINVTDVVESIEGYTYAIKYRPVTNPLIPVSSDMWQTLIPSFTMVNGATSSVGATTFQGTQNNVDIAEAGSYYFRVERTNVATGEVVFKDVLQNVAAVGTPTGVSLEIPYVPQIDLAANYVLGKKVIRIDGNYKNIAHQLYYAPKDSAGNATANFALLSSASPIEYDGYHYMEFTLSDGDYYFFVITAEGNYSNVASGTVEAISSISAKNHNLKVYITSTDLTDPSNYLVKSVSGIAENKIAEELSKIKIGTTYANAKGLTVSKFYSDEECTAKYDSWTYSNILSTNVSMYVNVTNSTSGLTSSEFNKLTEKHQYEIYQRTLDGKAKYMTFRDGNYLTAEGDIKQFLEEYTVFDGKVYSDSNCTTLYDFTKDFDRDVNNKVYLKRNKDLSIGELTIDGDQISWDAVPDTFKTSVEYYESTTPVTDFNSIDWIVRTTSTDELTSYDIPYEYYGSSNYQTYVYFRVGVNACPSDAYVYSQPVLVYNAENKAIYDKAVDKGVYTLKTGETTDTSLFTYETVNGSTYAMYKFTPTADGTITISWLDIETSNSWGLPLDSTIKDCRYYVLMDQNYKQVSSGDRDKNKEFTCKAGVTYCIVLMPYSDDTENRRCGFYAYFTAPSE